ncbi:hypothetical protein FRB94_004891, partial [Tulasnella sp. JGI-2019a]
METFPGDLFEAVPSVQNELSTRPLRPMVDTDWNRVTYYGEFVNHLIIHSGSFANGLLTILTNGTMDL